MNYVYLIDPQKAPSIVQRLIEFLRPLTEYEAEESLIVLLRFLDVRPPLDS